MAKRRTVAGTGKTDSDSEKSPFEKKKQKKSRTLSHPRIFENDKFCV
jgi:hypothetical protein